MLKLYDKNHNFIGRILKYSDCKKESEAATGDATLSFTYLAGTFDIQNEYYVQTKDAEYVVKEVSGSRTEGQEIVAVLNLEDLEQNAFQEFSVTDATIEEAARLFLAGTGWRVGECTVTKRRNAGMRQVDARQGILKLCTAFMCEPVFDTRAKTVSFYEEVGEDKGVYFLKGLNLRKLSKTQNSYDFYTRIIPIGADGLTIEGVNGGVNYLENHQYSDKIRTMIWQDDSYTDAQALMEDAERKLDDLSKPVVEYAADIIDLAAQKPEYGILSFHLGDTITLIDQDTGTRDKQRIRKITEYEQEPERNTCELGNTVLTFEELQDKLQAAAEIVGYTMTSDGKIHVSDILKWEEGVAGSQAVQGLNSSVSTLNGQLGALSLLVGTINANYLSAEEASVKYADIERLNAAEATVHSIQGDYASFKSTVTDELSAQTALIEDVLAKTVTTDYLEANYASIESLNAINAAIEILKTNQITVEYLAANYADIESLNTTNAVVESLSTRQADFETVMTGRLTAQDAQIEELRSTQITVEYLDAHYLNADTADLRYVTAEKLNATNAEIEALKASQITAEYLETNYATIESLNATNATVGSLSAKEAAFETATTENFAAQTAAINDLKAAMITTGYLEANFAAVDLANIKDGCITTAMIGEGVVGTAQIADSSITDAKIVELTANKITAGTLSVERLEIRGSKSSIVYALNNITGALQAENVNTLNGEILTERTITADKIVAKAITANEIAAKTITANSGIIADAAITNAMIASLDAGKITAGTLAAARIGAGTIDASKLSVSTLSAISANLGTVTAGTIRSATYTYSSGNYSTSGMEISLAGAGYIRAKNFAVDASGNAYFKGTVDATALSLNGAEFEISRSGFSVKKYKANGDGSVSSYQYDGLTLSGYDFFLPERSIYVKNIAVKDASAETLNCGSYEGNEINVYQVKENSVLISDKYAAKSHTHAYLPLSGGTLTGTLVVNTGGTGNYNEGIQINRPDSQWATIRMGGTSAAGTGENIWSIHRTNANNFAISRNSSDGKNGLFLGKNGNMGLGTTSPAYRLDVSGAIRASGAIYENNTALSSKYAAVSHGYHVVGRTINASFSTAFRTQTKGDANSGDYIAPIRNDTSGVANSPIYGTGVAFGRADTHGYMYMNYSTAELYVGAGNAGKLNWTRQVSFTDHTHNYAGSASAGGAANSVADAAGGTPITFNYGGQITTTSWIAAFEGNTKVIRAISPANLRTTIGAAASSHTHTPSSIGAAAASHTHNSVIDAGNNSSATTFAYSKAGLTTTSWFAAWNGYELRAISPAYTLSTIGAAAAGHTHADLQASINSLNTRMQDKANGVFSYSGYMGTNGYMTVTHNKNLGTNYHPIVSINCSIGHAMLCYGVRSITTNSFEIGIMYADGYNLSAPSANTLITIYWTY